MNDIIQNVIEIVIGVAVIIVVRYLIPYIKSKVKDTEYAAIYSIVEDAVKMAEQTMKAKGAGAEKKATVLNVVKQIMAENSYQMSDEQLNNMIESIVYIMNKED